MNPFFESQSIEPMANILGIFLAPNTVRPVRNLYEPLISIANAFPLETFLLLKNFSFLVTFSLKKLRILNC